MKSKGHACGAGGRKRWPEALVDAPCEGSHQAWLCEQKRECGAWSAGQRKVVMDKSLKSLLSQETLERIVQDVHSHEELVFLNVLHVYLAG